MLFNDAALCGELVLLVALLLFGTLFPKDEDDRCGCGGCCCSKDEDDLREPRPFVVVEGASPAPPFDVVDDESGCWTPFRWRKRAMSLSPLPLVGTEVELGE